MRENPKMADRFLRMVEMFRAWGLNSGKFCRTQIPYPSLIDLTYPMKVAADQVNLKYTYGCVYTGNNRYHCRYFFLPGDTSTYIKNGRDAYILNLENVSIIKIERDKPNKKRGQAKYTLRRLLCIPQVKSIDDLTEFFIRLSAVQAEDFPGSAKSSDFRKNQDVTLNRKLLFDFLSCYVDILCRYGVISPNPSTYIGWLDLGDTIGYISADVSCDPIKKEEVIDHYLPTAIDPETSLWFAASMFSLVKPLYEICEIKCNTRFALQILTAPRPDREKYKNALRLLELQAHMWCDFREWPEKWNSQPSSKFRKIFGKNLSLEFYKNCGFPIIIFGYRFPDGEEIEVNGTKKKDDKYFEESDEYSPDISLSKQKTVSKEFLRYVCSANCLPILIPGIAPQRNYPKDRMVSEYGDATATLNLYYSNSGEIYADGIANYSTHVGEVFGAVQIIDSSHLSYEENGNRLDMTYDAAAQSLIVEETGSFGGIGVTFAGTYFRSDSVPDSNTAEPVQSNEPSDADVAAALAEIMPAVLAVPGQWSVNEWGTVSITPRSTVSGAFSISGSVDIMMAQAGDGSWFAEASDNSCTITYNYAGEYYEDAANQRGFVIDSTVKVGGGIAVFTVTPLDFTQGSDPTGMDYSCYLEWYDGPEGTYDLRDANYEIGIILDENMEPCAFSYEF